MSKFKVGDKVKALSNYGSSIKGDIYTIADCWYNPNHNLYFVRLVEHLSKHPEHSHITTYYELVETNPILTPEEVFEHLRKGTKLQVRHTGKVGHKDWCDVVKPELTTYEVMIVAEWRIKPEPDVIELNGKKYREIIE